MRLFIGFHVLHMPIAELLFAAGFGMYWSSVYEHFTWRRGGEPLTADGGNRSPVVP